MFPSGQNNFRDLTRRERELASTYKPTKLEIDIKDSESFIKKYNTLREVAIHYYSLYLNDSPDPAWNKITYFDDETLGKLIDEQVEAKLEKLNGK